MRTHYTIGELAGATGVPTSTVRYYERVGLLKPSGRTAGNYRLYAEEDLERLRFIRAAQASGFTLDDAATMLDQRHVSAASCRDVQGLIENRLVDVRRRMEDLRQVERVLESALETCRRTEGSGHCEVIGRLGHARSRSLVDRRPTRGKKRP